MTNKRFYNMLKFKCRYDNTYSIDIFNIENNISFSISDYQRKENSIEILSYLFKVLVTKMSHEFMLIPADKNIHILGLVVFIANPLTP